MSKPSLTKEELTEIEIKVLNHLGYGHKNANSLKNLCLLTGIKERKLRMAIESLRRQGWSVLIPPKSPFGYFLAENQQELDAYVAYMKHRLIEEYKTYRIVRKTTIKKFDKTIQLPLMPL
ncbi:MAG: hypothetical protein WC389_16330 [Lutibacter sp.]|jgi:hypothetical protein